MKRGYAVFYGSSDSILLVNSLGRIRELFTPFRVKVLDDIGDLKKGTFVYVEQVIGTPEDKLVFITNTGIYPQCKFRIVASF